ncbi:MAG: histidine kinase [Heteroscytonema crispum UTEX LB 1556]
MGGQGDKGEGGDKGDKEIIKFKIILHCPMPIAHCPFHVRTVIRNLAIAF